MGLGAASKYTGGRQSTGEPDPLEREGFSGRRKRHEEHEQHAHTLFARQSFLNLPTIGFLGLGGKRTTYPEETIVGSYSGFGKDHGLPTTDDPGKISLIYRQVGTHHIEYCISGTR